MSTSPRRAEDRDFTYVPPQETWKLDARTRPTCTSAPTRPSAASNITWTPDTRRRAAGGRHVVAHPVARRSTCRSTALIYAGAQKNIGPAGLTVVIVRDDLIGQALPICPSAFDYKTVADNDSMFNTPPTYAIYIAGLVFEWLKQQGGVAAMEQRNIAKAQLLYDDLDADDFYQNRSRRTDRSRMNVPFYLRDERSTSAFLAGAEARGLLQLKGHNSVGGMRASIYNAMPIEGVQALVDYLNEFAGR